MTRFLRMPVYMTLGRCPLRILRSRGTPSRRELTVRGNLRGWELTLCGSSTEVDFTFDFFTGQFCYQISQGEFDGRDPDGVREAHGKGSKNKLYT